MRREVSQGTDGGGRYTIQEDTRLVGIARCAVDRCATFGNIPQRTCLVNRPRGGVSLSWRVSHEGNCDDRACQLSRCAKGASEASWSGRVAGCTDESADQGTAGGVQKTGQEKVTVRSALHMGRELG